MSPWRKHSVGLHVMDRRRLAWGDGIKPHRTASEVLGPQLDDSRRGDADSSVACATRSGSSFWSANSRASTANSQVCGVPKTNVRDDFQKDSDSHESMLPEQWESRLAHTMTLRTVQNTMRHAHQLLQLLTKRYGSSSALHISCWEGALEKVAAATGGSKAMVQKCHSRQRELAPLHISEVGGPHKTCATLEQSLCVVVCRCTAYIAVYSETMQADILCRIPTCP